MNEESEIIVSVVNIMSVVLQKHLREIIDSPEQPMVVQLRKHHPGLAMPSVPIPKLSSTEFLSNAAGRDTKVKVFDIGDIIVLVVMLDKKSDKEVNKDG